MDRAELECLASFDGAVRIDASELKELLEELEAAEKGKVASLFELLDTTGAGSMHISTSDEQGNIQTLVIVARDENAEALMEAYKQAEADDGWR